MGFLNFSISISEDDAKNISKVIEDRYSPVIRDIFIKETRNFFGEGEYTKLFNYIDAIKFHVAENDGNVGKMAANIVDELGNSSNHEKFDRGIFEGIHGNINEVKTKVDKLNGLEDKISELGNLKTEIISAVKDELGKIKTDTATSVKGEVEKLANVPEILQTLTDKVTALEKLPADLETLKIDVGTIKNFSADFETLKTDVAEIKDFKNILQSLQGDIAEIKKFATDLQTLKDDNAILKNNLDGNTAKILRLFNESIIKQQEQVTALTGEVEKIKAEKTQLEGKISMFENSLQSKETDLNNKTAELQQAQADLKMSADNLQQVENTVATLQLKFENAEREAQENSQILDAWRNKTNIYAPVRDALKNCPTFAPIVEKYHLAADDSEVSLLTFAQVLGVTESFNYEVHKTAVEYKKSNSELMTPTESNVYDALNRAYRAIWNIDFDIFVTPAGKSVTEPFTPENFDKRLAVHLKDPRNKDWSKINAIYVPMLKTKTGEYSQSAYVEASNR